MPHGCTVIIAVWLTECHTINVTFTILFTNQNLTSGEKEQILTILESLCGQRVEFEGVCPQNRCLCLHSVYAPITTTPIECPEALKLNGHWFGQQHQQLLKGD